MPDSGESRLDRRNPRGSPCVYIASNERMEDCWIIYFDRNHFVGLGSSRIMLISRTTRAEVYFGSANDEG